VSNKEYRDGLISHGVPESRADMLLDLFAASRNGDFGAVDPTLQRLLGRPPMSMRDVLAAAYTTDPAISAVKRPVWKGGNEY
jgi:NAD(P)H dehydrogenase (quinone)